LNHFVLLFTYYFFPICCTISNDLKLFKHIANLPWRMNPKKHHQCGHFFIQMWPCKVQLLVFSKAKNTFRSIQTVISCNLYSEIFWNFTQTSILWDPTITHVKKCCFFKILVLVLEIVEMAILECFWSKHSQKHLGVQEKCRNQTLLGSTQFKSLFVQYPSLGFTRWKKKSLRIFF